MEFCVPPRGSGFAAGAPGFHRCRAGARWPGAYGASRLAFVQVTAKRPAVRLAERVDVEIDKIRGSRFIATLLPAADVEHVLAEQKVLRLAHPHSRHVCYAHIADTEERIRFSDDGEPSKTAGLPMVRVLLGASLRQAGVLVVRYFGGVKLGTGGLVRAYTAAVREAVCRATLLPVEPSQRVGIRCTFAAEPAARHLLSQHANIVAADYAPQAVVLWFECPGQRLPEVLRRLGARVGGDVELLS